MSRSGPNIPHAERLADGRRRVLVQVYLSEAAGKKLARLAKLHGSKRAAIEAAIVEYEPEPK